MSAAQSSVGDFQTFAKSYRYLRMGLVGTVLLLASSVAVEVQDRGCFKGSISAYYHTPVRTVFVGGLIAIGFGLIILRGRTDTEDMLLNLAGMLAPIVAMVPTGDDGLCLATDAEATRGFGRDDLARIDNNLKALFVVGLAGVAVGFAFAVRASKSQRDKDKVTLTTWAGLAVAAASVLGVFALYQWRRSAFLDNAHGTSAVLMFALLGVVSAMNGWNGWLGWHPKLKGWRSTYLAIGVLMGLVAVGFSIFGRSWNHRILAIEIGEITLFALYWVLQTIDTWGDENRYRIAYHKELIAQAVERVKDDPQAVSHARVLISQAALARAFHAARNPADVPTLSEVVNQAEGNSAFREQAIRSWKEDLAGWSTGPPSGATKAAAAAPTTG